MAEVFQQLLVGILFRSRSCAHIRLFVFQHSVGTAGKNMIAAVVRDLFMLNRILQISCSDLGGIGELQVVVDLLILPGLLLELIGGIVIHDLSP